MRKVKLIVHETYQGKRKSEDVFAAVFLSNAAALTPNTHSGIIKDTERSQDSLCSEKGATYSTGDGSAVPARSNSIRTTTIPRRGELRSPAGDHGSPLHPLSFPCCRGVHRTPATYDDSEWGTC